MNDDRQNLPSASAWRRFELCAGSWQLEGEARRLNQLAHETSPAAERGTLIHAYLAGEPDEDGKPIELGEDEQQTADFLQQRSQDQIARLFDDAPWQQLDEKRLWFIRDGRKLASGKFDRCIYNDKLAVVQDFKSGHAEPQEATTSSQMKLLAVLVGLALPNIKEIVVQVVSIYFGVSERRFFIEDLAEAYRDVSKTLRAIEAPNAPLNPSPEACRFCPAISCCPAVKALVPSMREVEALPDGDRGAALLDSVEILQKRLDAIREFYAARLAEDPAFDLPGYALIPNAPRREIEDVEAAKSRLAEFLDAGELNTAMNLKVGQVEKIFGRKVGLKGKELREKFNAVMQGVLIEKTPSPSLKRTSGKPKLVEIQLP